MRLSGRSHALEACDALAQYVDVIGFSVLVRMDGVQSGCGQVGFRDHPGGRALADRPSAGGAWEVALPQSALDGVS